MNNDSQYRQSDESVKRVSAKEEFGCRYVPAYSSPCGALIADENGFCAKHKKRAQCCVKNCENRATHECNHCGQFVCGAPLCDDCHGTTDETKTSGCWGFMNHIHRKKPVESRSHKIAIAVASDFGLTSPLSNGDIDEG